MEEEPKDDSDLDWEDNDAVENGGAPMKMEPEDDASPNWAAYRGMLPAPPIEMDEEAQLEVAIDASNLEELAQWPDIALARLIVPAKRRRLRPPSAHSGMCRDHRGHMTGRQGLAA